MRSTTRTARRAALNTIASAVMALALMLTMTATAEGHPHYGGHCADRLCTRYVPHTPSCHRFASGRKVSRCFIARAAQRFGQSRSEAYAIAWRESRYNPHATNSSSGAAGLYQFMPGTWAHTPYRHHSAYSARWAALGAMWMWKHGYKSHWAI
ncbi:MAG: Transglycosylase domain [Solirubrobacteraceae bacterium]|nr:Transglycosylase domain [Solirubrobacteraceae bacterium]